MAREFKSDELASNSNSEKHLKRAINLQILIREKLKRKNIDDENPAIGLLTRLFSRHMYKFIETHKAWKIFYLISSEVKSELNSSFLNHGFGVKCSPLITKIVYTDLSGGNKLEKFLVKG